MDRQSIALIAGTLFSLIGSGTLVHFAWIVRRWPKTRGRVVDNSSKWSPSGGAGGPYNGAAYYPVIEFNACGRTHRATGGVGKRQPWEPGEMVEIYYKPSNPETILDLNAFQRFLFSGLFIAFGAAALAAGMGLVH